MTLTCNNQLIDLSIPKVMGILNCTPDSFYDGGKHNTHTQLLHQTEKMLSEGATFIDLGAYSSRPGASIVTLHEEENRIVPLVKLLVKTFPNILLSIDTFRSSVAEKCLTEGASLINDISAGNLDPHLMSVVARFQVPYILMHMKGNPQNMTTQTNYTHMLTDIGQYFSEKINQARNLGINDCIIDPGFGFSKTLEQNYQLLHNIDYFTHLNLPVLVGLSRKSMIYKPLNTTPQQALNGTTALHAIALNKGAQILRVHDVKEAVETITLMQILKSAQNTIS